MSKLILLCNNPKQKKKDLSAESIDEITHRLTPDNLKPNPTRLIHSPHARILILNPVNSIRIDKASVCLGTMIKETPSWPEPFAEVPMGTYALFRSNQEHIELVSDGVASRTIWYYIDENTFIASTSQRAIIMLIGSFQFNVQVIPWMLTSGVTGPDISYDKRIRCLPPDTRCVHTIATWKTELQTTEPRFESDPAPAGILKNTLEAELENVFSGFSKFSSNWVLPLSGGVDSRGLLLLLLKQNIKINTITWGSPDSLDEPGSDAYIAKLLSKKLEIPNEFFTVEDSETSFETIVDRFLTAGEGRIDHLAGYLDGFELWKNLFSQHVEGIIRGDEGFGWGHVYEENDVFHSLGINIANEGKLWNTYKCLGIPDPVVPGRMKQLPGESLETWRDRLYHIYRIPIMLAALNDLKLPYVEIANPFLTQNLIAFTRRLPDKYRTGKKLFRNYISSISPAIPYATTSALKHHPDVFKSGQAVDYLFEEISRFRQNDLFGSDFMHILEEQIIKLKQDIPSIAVHNRIVPVLKRLLPARIKSLARKKMYTKEIDFKIFLFRILILLKMNEIFKSDGSLRLN